MDEWRDQELEANLRALEHFRASTWEPLNREWEKYSDATHYRAAVMLERLRPQLREAEAALRVMDGDVLLRERRERLVNVLRPIYRQERADLEGMVRALASTVETPGRPTMLNLFARGRHLDYLRRQLHQATGADEFAREWSAVDDLRRQWEAQAAARAKVFSHHLSPSHRPTPEPAPWAEALGELVALQQEAENVLV